MRKARAKGLEKELFWFSHQVGFKKTMTLNSLNVGSNFVLRSSAKVIWFCTVSTLFWLLHTTKPSNKKVSNNITKYADYNHPNKVKHKYLQMRRGEETKTVNTIKAK